MSRKGKIVTTALILVVILGGYYAYTELYSQPTNDTPTETENVNDSEDTTGTSTNESVDTNEGTNAQEDTADEERPEDGAEYVFRATFTEKVENSSIDRQLYKVNVFTLSGVSINPSTLNGEETVIVEQGDCTGSWNTGSHYLLKAVYNAQHDWYVCEGKGPSHIIDY